MIFDPQQLVEATQSTSHRPGPAGRICTDSRALKPGDWFLALVGERFDGHEYLHKAAENQCAGIIAQTIPENWQHGFVQVNDTLQALQDIARYARKRFHGTVVGITGSAGKTTTRAMAGTSSGKEAITQVTSCSAIFPLHI